MATASYRFLARSFGAAIAVSCGRAAAAGVAAAGLTQQELSIAEQVHVGHIPCELGASVNVTADANAPGHFHVDGKGFKYHMAPVATTTDRPGNTRPTSARQFSVRSGLHATSNGNAASNAAAAQLVIVLPNPISSPMISRRRDTAYRTAGC